MPSTNSNYRSITFTALASPSANPLYQWGVTVEDADGNILWEGAGTTSPDDAKYDSGECKGGPCAQVADGEYIFSMHASNKNFISPGGQPTPELNSEAYVDTINPNPAQGGLPAANDGEAMKNILCFFLAAISLQISPTAFAASVSDHSVIYGPIALGSRLNYVKLKKLGEFQVSDGAYGDKTITFDQPNPGNEYKWLGGKPLRIEMVFFNLRLWAETIVYPSNDVVAELLATESGQAPPDRQYDCWRGEQVRHSYSIIRDEVSVISVDISIDKERQHFTGEPPGPECRFR
jgi:hypothetical protein